MQEQQAIIEEQRKLELELQKVQNDGGKESAEQAKKLGDELLDLE